MIQLRRIRQGDLGLLFKMRNDPSVYKWCRQYAPLHWEAHEAWYLRQARDSSLEMFAVSVYEELVGCVGLTSIDLVNRRAEFSCYIGKDHQGKGYGKEALKLLLEFGFMDLGLNRIWGESFAGNPALLVFEKLGFQKEGIRLDHYYRAGRFIDAHLVSISASEYFAAKSSKETKSATKLSLHTSA